MSRARGLVVVLVAAMFVAAAPAQTLVYSGFPWGTATIFGSGDAATRLSVVVPGAGEEEVVYLAADTLPATATVTGEKGGKATASLTIGDSNISGLAITGALSLSGVGLPSDSAANISLSFLVNLSQGAVVRIADLSLTASGNSQITFRLTPSDASGSLLGDSVLTLDGSADGYLVSPTAGWFRVDMDASAEGSGPATLNFSYRLDLDSLDTVPEPSTVALGALGAVAMFLMARARAGPTVTG